MNWQFTSQSCMVARPAGRERKPCEHAPPAHPLAVIGYTTTRDAIECSGSLFRVVSGYALCFVGSHARTTDTTP